MNLDAAQLQRVLDSVEALGARLSALEARLGVKADDASTWDETKHPRAKDGKFGSGGGAAASGTPEKTPEAPGAPAKPVEESKPPEKVEPEAPKNVQKPAEAPTAPEGASKTSQTPQAPKPVPKLFDEAEVEALPANAVQPVKTQQELYARAAPALEELKTWLDKGEGLASRLGVETMNKSPEAVTDEEWKAPGAMLFIAPLKGEKRAVEKVNADYGGDWSKLKDAVRCSLAFDTMDDLNHTLKVLKANGLKLAQKPKDRFAKPTAEGYRDLLLNVELPNGMIGEVQMHVKPVLLAKNEAHHYYEIQRTIAIKDPSEWTPEEKSKYQAAAEKSRELYEGAWTQATGGAKEKTAVGDAVGTKSGWKYYEHQDALFRAPVLDGLMRYPVSQVRIAGEWKKYEGDDRMVPVVYGAEVEEPGT